MPGFGMTAGFGAGRYRTAHFLSKQGPAALLAPHSDWTGIPGSGFTSIPSDPERLTAKPALRLVTPPNIFFLDETIVGVAAYANDSGTLIGGVDRVRFHFEGNSIDVVEPTLRSFSRRDGSEYTVLGYWMTLSKPPSASGEAQLYIEAEPSDATMQRRVLGPFSYYPINPFQTTGNEHDAELTVQPSQPQVEGVNYQTVGAAMSYCKVSGFENPNITLLEDIADENLSDTFNAGGLYFPSGYMHIRTAPGVTASYSKPTYTTDIASSFRFATNGMHFEGDHTFDLENVQTFYEEFVSDNPNWFDRVRFTNSAGKTALWRKGVRPFKPLLRNISYMTDCQVDNLRDPIAGVTLVRGCLADNNFGDVMTSTLCGIGNIVTRHESSSGFNYDIDALSIAGPAGATVAVSGGVDGTRTFTLKEFGTLVSTFRVNSGVYAYSVEEPGYDPTTDGFGYSVQNVADWINSLSGWSATLLDDTRRASALALAGQKGVGFGDTDASAGLTLTTTFDLHNDFWQQQRTAENVIIEGNFGYGLQAQIFLIGDQLANSCHDFIFVNNALMSDLQVAEYYAPEQSVSQLASTAQSHVCFAHNSLPFQAIWMRTQSGYDPDNYCVIANNAVADLIWFGAPDPDIRLSNNILDATSDAPANADNTILAGGYQDKFVDAVVGDMAPAGLLLANGLAPIVAYDAVGTRRGASAPAGALS
ncbi:hypothetical protein [Erythrobacter sp. MTPC3]|uniref:hypothetical protein n=1 Tax=Erythrobacter sp. MTPC3 TaxID=3056564 RepID=UPI0036F39242